MMKEIQEIQYRLKNRLKNSMGLRWCVVLLLVTVVYSFAVFWREHRFLPEGSWLICWNGSGSVPKGLYLRVPVGILEDGDYVVFEPNELTASYAVARGWSKPGTLFLKEIGALPGENYCVNPDTLQFYANGRYIGQASQRDHEGRPLPSVIRGSYIVPAGEFLPIGRNSSSFDGRYTGTVPLGNIRAKVTPLLTGFW